MARAFALLHPLLGKQRLGSYPVIWRRQRGARDALEIASHNQRFHNSVSQIFGAGPSQVRAGDVRQSRHYVIVNSKDFRLSLAILLTLGSTMLSAPQSPTADKPSADGKETDSSATGHETLKYSLLGPSLTKAGQDSVDQSKVCSKPCSALQRRTGPVKTPPNLHRSPRSSTMPQRGPSFSTTRKRGTSRLPSELKPFLPRSAASRHWISLASFGPQITCLLSSNSRAI